MYPQIHPGDGYQQEDHNAGNAQPEPPRKPGHAAEEAHRRLGVPAGEAVPRRLRPGGFDNGKAGVPDPGAGDPADDFEPLVHQHAHKTHAEQIIAFPLVHAPEDQQRPHHEEGLFSQMGYQRHEDVQDRVSDGFEPVEQFHFTRLLAGNFLFPL